MSMSTSQPTTTTVAMELSMPTDSPMVSNPLFNPTIQMITLLLPDGTTPFNTTLDQVNWYIRSNLALALQQGVETGASILMLIVLLLLTPATKRRTAMFLSNLAALAANAVRMVLKCVYRSSAWMDVYLQLTGDVSALHSADYHNSVAGVVMSFVTFVLVMGALIIQVRVATGSMARGSVLRWALLLVLALLAMGATALQGAAMVANCRIIVDAQLPDEGLIRLLRDTLILTMVTMMIFTVVFAGKLATVMWIRRKLGQKQFGPMQVLFIMGVQSMIIPTIVALLSVFTDLAHMEEWYLTLVALLLPLSSLWAAATPNSPQASAHSTGSWRLRLFGLGSKNLNENSTVNSGSGVNLMNVGSGLDKSRNESIIPLSPNSEKSKDKSFLDIV